MPEATHDYFNRISNAAGRMRVLIEDLLNLSRVTVDGKIFIRTELNKVLQDAITSYDLKISEKNARIEAGALPEIECIPAQMKQLFENLLSNALKFTDQEVPLIKIESHKLGEEELKRRSHLDENNVWYEILFSDNGIGFDQKFAGQIFNAFQRLHDIKKYPGTGIGLALCKKIVYNHKGEIFAESKEGDGTVFHILLPERRLEKNGAGESR
jgi:signal transduction histidine kinase